MICQSTATMSILFEICSTQLKSDMNKEAQARLFTVLLFLTTQTQKQPRSFLEGELKNKLQYPNII